MPTLPVRRDDVERLAHGALDAARHPVRTVRATAGAVRHPLRTTHAAAGQLRTAVITVAGRVVAPSSADGRVPPPTDAAPVLEVVELEVIEAPEPVPEDAAAGRSASGHTTPRDEPAVPATDPVAEDVDDLAAAGLDVPLSPMPHIPSDIERDIAGELEPDPVEPQPRPADDAPLADPGTAKAIRKEADRAARASDPGHRRS